MPVDSVHKVLALKVSYLSVSLSFSQAENTCGMLALLDDVPFVFIDLDDSESEGFESFCCSKGRMLLQLGVESI